MVSGPDGISVEKATIEGVAHDFGYLALAKEVADAAAHSTDLDRCLRLLRAGLVRIGFSRAGIWLTTPESPGLLQGTWGTGWRGEEVDERALRLPFRSFMAWDRVTVGEKVVLLRFARPADLHGPSLQLLPLLEGPPNCASVALRVDSRLLGIISVDMLPGEESIPPHSVAMLELLADIVATAIARTHLVTALQTTNQVLTTEVAERQRAEQQVVQRERRHRLLIESTYDVYAVINRDGTIQDVSPSVERVFGYAIDEIVGRPITMIVHPDDLAKHEIDLRKTLPQIGKPFSGERRYLTKHRGWRTFDVVGVNYLDDPSVNGIIATFRDVTERRQEQKMEAIGRLAGGVAHDFNNLLTVINGYANLLANGMADEEKERRAIEQIRRASENAAVLTSQLLAFGRRQIVTPQETDLNAVVGRVSQMLRRVLGDDINLVTQLASDLHGVKVDPRQIEQALLNLGANAREAMPRGGTLTVQTANAQGRGADRDAEGPEESGDRVLLTVSDTGVGMDETVLAHLFEPFFTAKEVDKGVRLGLAAVYGIVKQSGGTITVSSTPGQGSSFHLSFPPSDYVKTTSPMQPSGPASSQGKATIMVVEDEEELRTLVRLVLERGGYHVLAAEDGDQALAIAARFADTIDLLVTDVVLPGLGGREVAEKLLKQRPSMRVLYTSGYTDDMVLRHGIREAEVAFLPKPFTPRELIEKVGVLLDRREYDHV